MNKVDTIITSRKSPLIIKTASLHEKKYRYECGLFLIEGEKLVTEAAVDRLPIVQLFFSAGKVVDLWPRIRHFFDSSIYQDLNIYTVSDECFLKISSEKAPQGVIAVLKYLDFFERKTIIYDEDILSLMNDRTILLYAMQDPGNLGAVIRSAAAFGVRNLLLSSECADLYNSKTIRAAMGSLFRVHAWIVEDFVSAIQALQRNHRRVLAAELRDGSIPLSEISITHRDCILIGNEGHGIPKSLSELCAASVYLPISKNAESLNASVAASIFLWEQSKA